MTLCGSFKKCARRFFIVRGAIGTLLAYDVRMDKRTFGSGGYEVTLTQSVTGAVVLHQTDDNIIIIPAEHVRAAALAMALCVHQLVPSASVTSRGFDE